MSTLLSSIERAVLKSPGHIIPPITDPTGNHWQQPDRLRIEIDDTHALMSKADFDKLLDYSHSQPTGTYPGKMWKRQRYDWQRDGLGRIMPNQQPWPTAQTGEWTLCWFGEIFTQNSEEYLKNYYRRILIV